MDYFETKPFWDAQLEHSTIVPDFAAWQDRHESLSAQADALGLPERIPTGPDDSQAVWRTTLGRTTHALTFIHGGYWQRNTANCYSFVAETAAASKSIFYNVDHRLMPHARMEELVEDAVQACEIARRYSERMILVGHSSGAHLAVEAAMRMSEPPEAVVAISGLYELDPLRYAVIQDELSLTLDEVRAFSPKERAAALRCPIHLFAGAEETMEYQRQSARMYEAVRDAGGSATITFVDGHHHSSLIAELADPHTALSRSVQRLVG